MLSRIRQWITAHTPDQPNRQQRGIPTPWHLKRDLLLTASELQSSIAWSYSTAVLENPLSTP